MPPSRLQAFRQDQLAVEVYADRAEAGKAAGERAAEAIREALAAKGSARVIFAAAPSQNETLATLAAAPGIDWSLVTALHMDEYLGIDSGHPASFRRYLREHILESVGLSPDRFRPIPGESAELPGKVALAYEEGLRSAPIDLVLAGIGENGHLAFNDPPVADFLDPLWVKVVRLDEPCRRQQVNDGCFPRFEDVPTHAYTLTVPALLSGARLVVSVPGPRKAEAVRATLRGPVGEACPATALRGHADATLYLDRDSANLLG
jgi:glucosamine-6-phosphate deaminase